MCEERKDPFAEVYAACNAGTLGDKIRDVPDFPHLVDIELAHVCYLQCKMCPVGGKFGKRPPSRMSFDIAKKILDECASHKTPVRFIGWGEPTQSEWWKDDVRHAHYAGLLTHMNTNGQWLNDIKDFAYLDSLKFSLQGYTFDEYHEIRKGASYSLLTNNVFRARTAFPDLYITVGTTTSPMDTVDWQQAKLFREFWTMMGADKITIGVTRNLSVVPNLLSRIRTAPTTPNCPELWGRLTIQADGSVTPCCSDYNGDMVVGNIATNSLQEIWDSDNLRETRQKFLADNGTGYIPCRRCDL